MSGFEYYPMLAQPLKKSVASRRGDDALFLQQQESVDFVFEPKLDGIRCIAIINGESVTLWSRTGKDITISFPDVVEQLRPFAGESVDIVLDGEIVAPFELNLSPPFHFYSDFQALQTRLQRKTNIVEAALEVPAYFVPFDLLSWEGVKQITLPYLKRYERLQWLLCIGKFSERYTIFPVHVDSAAKYLPDYIQAGGEGLIAKHKRSRYYIGTRSSDWLKIKPVQHTQAIIVGYTHGIGRRYDLMGGLIAAQKSWNDDYFYAATVGSGLTDELMRELLSVLKVTPTRPNFAPGTIVPNVKAWVEPTHYMNIKFLERTAEGRLRHPILETVHRYD